MAVVSSGSLTCSPVSQGRAVPPSIPDSRNGCRPDGGLFRQITPTRPPPMALSLTQTTGTPLAARSCRPGRHIPNPAMYISPSSGTAPRLIARSILSRSRSDSWRSSCPGPGPSRPGGLLPGLAEPRMPGPADGRHSAGQGRHPRHAATQSGQMSRVSAEAACEILHKALPRKRHGRGCQRITIQIDALSAADAGGFSRRRPTPARRAAPPRLRTRLLKRPHRFARLMRRSA